LDSPAKRKPASTRTLNKMVIVQQNISLII
jgi:hypothetical protein